MDEETPFYGIAVRAYSYYIIFWAGCYDNLARVTSNIYGCKGEKM